jgi:hypothetical protein
MKHYNQVLHKLNHPTAPKLPCGAKYPRGGTKKQENGLATILAGRLDKRS